MKLRMILTTIVGFVHLGERYENWPRRGHIRPHRDFEYRGDFDDLGDVDRNLGSIKLKIPAFKGKTDLESYLDWEFTDYTMVWWERLVVERKRNRERPVRTREELKTIMKKTYVPKTIIGNCLIVYK